jgi:hypothetical protein
MAGWLAIKSRDCTASGGMRFTRDGLSLFAQVKAIDQQQAILNEGVESAHFSYPQVADLCLSSPAAAPI